MPNKSYQKGYRKERELVNKAREEGLIAGRMAGSHTPFDIYIIDFKNKKIKFIQSKNKKLYGKEKELLNDLRKFTDEYFVEFEVWSK